MDKRLKYITQEEICIDDDSREGYRLQIDVNEKIGPYTIVDIWTEVGMETEDVEYYEEGGWHEYLYVTYEIDPTHITPKSERAADQEGCHTSCTYEEIAAMDLFYCEGPITMRLREILKECGFSNESASIEGTEWSGQSPECAVYDCDSLAEEIYHAMKGAPHPTCTA